eukprot:4146133-Amphidinium_carterae.1
MVSWNARALMAQDPDRARDKINLVKKLSRKAGAIMIQKAHLGRVAAETVLPRRFKYFCSPHPDGAATGGVILGFSKRWLGNAIPEL